MKRWICIVWIAVLLCGCLPVAAEMQHPVGNTVYNGMLQYSARDIIRETMEAKRTAVAEAVALSSAAYADRVRAALPSNIITRPDYEKEAARLGQLYAADGDEAYAEKVLHALVLTAQNYEKISGTAEQNDFWNMANLIPAYLVIAYDLVYNSPRFAQMDALYGADTRALIENYFTALARRMYEENRGKYINNLGGFAIKNLTGTAWILNDPTMMRWAVALIDDAYAATQWYADGMWSEGTTSYGQQLLGNCLEAVQLIQKWDDPAGYQDDLLGLELHKTDLTSRWPLIPKAQQVIAITKYPNGATMAMHDTHPSGNDINLSQTIQEAHLDNFELNHFGLYAMRHGTTAGAQQVSLLFPPVAAGTPYGGGHGHGNYLALTYWANGAELLPDGGYPVAGSEPNRFFHMNAVTHNESWITAGITDYGALRGQYTRPALLAYDDGTTSGGKVQFIEASQLMPEAQQNDVKRRALVTVAVDDTHSYTLDVQRLRGGVVHENFLRGSEDEKMEVTSDMPVSSTAGNLGTQLKAEGKKGLMAGQTLFTEAKRGSAEKDSKSKWTGQQSGSSLHMFLKGVQGAEYALSSMPGMRQEGVNPPHLYQRREVSAQDTTVFGALYEGTRTQETAKVQDIRWIDFADSPMATLAVVDLGEWEDWIYLSDDVTPRTYNGIQFCGSAAVLHRKKADGAVQWGYVYGEGSICTMTAALYSAPDFTTRVVSAQGDMLTLEKDIPATLQGLWGMETFGDGTGLGHQMTEIQGQQVKLNGEAGYEIAAGGAKRTHFPAKITSNGSLDAGSGDATLSDWVQAGDVTLRIPQPVFGSLQPLGVSMDDAPEKLQPGKTYRIQALAKKTENAKLYAVVQKDSFADDSGHTLKKQEILTIRTAEMTTVGGGLMEAQTEVTMPEELETRYASGNVATRIRVKGYVWDDNLAPIAMAGAWE